MYDNSDRTRRAPIPRKTMNPDPATLAPRARSIKPVPSGPAISQCGRTPSLGRGSPQVRMTVLALLVTCWDLGQRNVRQLRDDFAERGFHIGTLALQPVELCTQHTTTIDQLVDGFLRAACAGGLPA